MTWRDLYHLTTVVLYVHFISDQIILYAFNMKQWQTGGALPVFAGSRMQRGFGRFRTQNHSKTQACEVWRTDKRKSLFE